MRRKVGTVLVVLIVLLVAAGTVARLFLFALAEPHHMAMAPAVLNGDELLLWRAGTPAEGEVIVYTREPGGATQAIGRVIAVGPTRVEIAAGGMPKAVGDIDIVRIPIAPDGTEAAAGADAEAVLGGRASMMETLPGGRSYRVILPARGGKGLAHAERSVDVPAGSYFVLNDNRGAPEPDSRSLGAIESARVLGIARWFLGSGPYATASHKPAALDPVL